MSMFVRTNSTIWGSVNQSDYKDSIVFIEDTEQIYSNGVYYGGKNNGLLLEKITFSEESILLNPDNFYVSDTILETLDITLNGDITKMNTYFVEFLCNNTCVILPSNIKWKNNIVPDFTKTAIMTIKIQDDTAYLIDCRPFIGPCVTFTALEDNSSIGLTKLSTKQTLEYSTDFSTWNTFNKTTNIFLNNGDKVYVRGVLSADNTYSNYTQFKMSGKIAASGNCNAIWNYHDLNTPLKAYCGKYMFRDCTSLTTAPELPATELADFCYITMFEGCTNLNYIKCLATNISATNCTINWVDAVTNTGTFIKHPDMNNWTTGNSGIPDGWTVENAEI